jgi:glyceraldehyde 3-phosphate dehydrogenase
VCEVKKKTSVEHVNSLFKKASKTKKMQNILEYTNEEIVSSDVIDNPSSCVFDSLRTIVDGDLVKVVAWYDNEWGYSNRIIDVVRKMG